jgi:hypothetical protein
MRGLVLAMAGNRKTVRGVATRVERALLRREAGALRQNRVAARTLNRYAVMFIAFLDFVFVKWGRDFRSYQELDDFAAGYVEHLWQEGDSKADASYTLAAIHYFLPRATGQLVFAWRLLSVWKRLELPLRATPLSLELLMAFIGYFIAADEAEVAVGCALMFHCILRTGELFLIEAKHLVFSRCGNRASLSLPITKSLNKRLGGCETVEVYDPRIVARLALLVKVKLPGDKLFGMSMSFFRIMLLRAASFFGLHDLQIQAYSLRRGGATHFFRMSGSLDRTVLRGRWLSAKSARIYIEDGVAQLSGIALSGDQVALVSRCKKLAARKF